MARSRRRHRSVSVHASDDDEMHRHRRLTLGDDSHTDDVPRATATSLRSRISRAPTEPVAINGRGWPRDCRTSPRHLAAPSHSRGSCRIPSREEARTMSHTECVRHGDFSLACAQGPPARAARPSRSRGDTRARGNRASWHAAASSPAVPHPASVDDEFASVVATFLPLARDARVVLGPTSSTTDAVSVDHRTVGRYVAENPSKRWSTARGFAASSPDLTSARRSGCDVLADNRGRGRESVAGPPGSDRPAFRIARHARRLEPGGSLAWSRRFGVRDRRPRSLDPLGASTSRRRSREAPGAR